MAGQMMMDGGTDDGSMDGRVERRVNDNDGGL